MLTSACLLLAVSCWAADGSSNVPSSQVRRSTDPSGMINAVAGHVLPLLVNVTMTLGKEAVALSAYEHRLFWRACRPGQPSPAAEELRPLLKMRMRLSSGKLSSKSWVKRYPDQTAFQAHAERVAEELAAVHRKLAPGRTLNDVFYRRQVDRIWERRIDRLVRDMPIIQGRPQYPPPYDEEEAAIMSAYEEGKKSGLGVLTGRGVPSPELQEGGEGGAERVRDEEPAHGAAQDQGAEEEKRPRLKKLGGEPRSWREP